MYFHLPSALSGIEMTTSLVSWVQFCLTSSPIRESGVRRLFEVGAYINFFFSDAALIRGRRLIEGGTLSSKYGKSALWGQLML